MTTMEEFTGETTFRGSRYLEETVRDARLVEIYYTLSQRAKDVHRAENELKSVVNDNASKFAEMLHLHRAEVVVTRAADYERAYARFDMVEKMFVEMAHDAGVSHDSIFDLLRVVREEVK